MLTSGLGMAIVLTDSLKLWSPAQDEARKISQLSNKQH